jgi:hypothetical protein
LHRATRRLIDGHHARLPFDLDDDGLVTTIDAEGLRRLSEAQVNYGRAKRDFIMAVRAELGRAPFPNEEGTTPGTGA